jgi:gamma-glutamyl-gamma-aminobutyrate hydrolase PuuD
MVIVIPAGLEKSTYQINKAYVEYIAGAGHIPLIAVPQNKTKELAQGRFGLLLPGGKDIDPIFYGDNNWGSHATDPEKDEFERELFWAFFKVGRPIFGICRGFQLMIREYILKNPEVGVDLQYQQHINSHAGTSELGLSRTIPSHYVKARTDLLYGGAKKKKVDYMPVNSMHHQYLHVYKDEKELEKTSMITPALQLTAWATRGLDADEVGVVGEGVIFRNWGKSKIAGVQWHPEELKDYDLLINHFGKE